MDDKFSVTPIPIQNVVPQPLIEHFISMTDSDLLLTVDAEMTYYCAYSLPAVALTLGSENWHILKGTVDYLASDLHYKVRKTLASSLHELAIILGPELATDKLAPLFEGFIKDLDEVRIGVLQHLAEFFQLIDPVKKNTYLPRLVDFLKTDYEWNWRFRDELGRQLLKAVKLFKPADTAKYIGVIAIDLLCDKVAAVRQVALSLVSVKFLCTFILFFVAIDVKCLYNTLVDNVLELNFMNIFIILPQSLNELIHLVQHLFRNSVSFLFQKQRTNLVQTT